LIRTIEQYPHDFIPSTGPQGSEKDNSEPEGFIIINEILTPWASRTVLVVEFKNSGNWSAPGKRAHMEQIRAQTTADFADIATED